MEKLRATLVVEEINGRRGPFCVGMLKTSMGDFKVTDKELDQFAPGSYAGEFLIEELRTKTVPWRQGTFTVSDQLTPSSHRVDERGSYASMYNKVDTYVRAVVSGLFDAETVPDQ